ncbi:MAG: PD-(D/E)XK nuclease family protein [Methanobacteriota archaeon]
MECEGELVSASDIEKFGYCPLSWWLSRNLQDDEDNEPLKSGTALHEVLAQELDGIRHHETKARQSETIIMWFAVAASLISLLGLNLILDLGKSIGEILAVLSLIWLLAAVFFLYRAETKATPENHLTYQRIVLVFAIVSVVIALNAVSVLELSVFWSQVLEISALMWLVGASYFLYWSLRHMQDSALKRDKHNVVGEIEYLDLNATKPEMLVSKAHCIRGRPDLILQQEGASIPVEIKTGRVPRGPLFSHILQVAAYCVILEDINGKPATHGLLRYGSVEHEVEYTPDLKKLVLEKAASIRAARKAGGAHRNHNRPSKCKGCSRRAACPEKLE